MAAVTEILLNGIITGFAVAIGSYLANRGLLEKMRKLANRINGRKK